MVRSFILVLLLLIFPFLTAQTLEAKLLPQAKGAQKAVTKSSSGGGIGVSPRFRGDREALILNFSNLQNASSVSYLFTYKTSTQDEGAGGNIFLTGAGTQSQELLFGTCSKNVCSYHTGIRDARLEVTYVTKAGKKYIKRYKIKV